MNNDEQNEAINRILGLLSQPMKDLDLTGVDPDDQDIIRKSAPEVLALAAIAPEKINKQISLKGFDFSGSKKAASIAAVIAGLATLIGKRKYKTDGMPQSMRAMVLEICAKCGVPVPEHLGCNSELPLDGAYSCLLDEDGKSAIFVHPFAYLWAGRQAIGYLAHEVAHLHYKHAQETKALISTFRIPECVSDPGLMIPSEFSQVYNIAHRHEYDADQFAADYGYGKELIWCLSNSAPDLAGKSFPQDTLMHPATADRLSRLRRQLDKAA